MRDDHSPTPPEPMLPLTGDTLGAALITDLYGDITRPTGARDMLACLNYFGRITFTHTVLDDASDSDLVLLLFANQEPDEGVLDDAWNLVFDALPTLAEQGHAFALMSDRPIVNLTKNYFECIPTQYRS